MSPAALPFALDLRDPLQVRSFISRINSDAFLVRSVCVPLGNDAAEGDSMVLPLWSAPTDNLAFRAVYLMVGKSKRAATAVPSMRITVQLRTAEGATTYGTYDSRVNAITAGTPFNVTGDVEVLLARGTEVIALLEPLGSPIMSLRDFTARVDYATTGGA